MKTKVLVTGANGQLGNTLQELQEDYIETVVFVFVSKERLDITKPDEMKAYFNKNNFDYCINCAAYTNVEQAEKTPERAFLVNAEGVKNLALQCKKHSITLIHVSTDYVFDGTKATPYEVGDKTNPVNEYGKSKLKGEQYIQQILKSFYIVRTSWLFSKKYGNNFYRTIINKAKKGENLTITVDQIGSPTNTENLSQFLMKLIFENEKIFGIYNYCDKEVMTWYDFAKMILREHNLLEKVTLVKGSKYITFAKRPKYSVLKCADLNV